MRRPIAFSVWVGIEVLGLRGTDGFIERTKMKGGNIYG
jgi:hypothetical protein